MLIPTGWVVVDAGMAEDNHSRLIQDASERCRGRGKSSFSKKRKEKKKDASEDLVNVVRPLVGIGKEISEMLKVVVCLLIVPVAVLMYKS